MPTRNTSVAILAFSNRDGGSLRFLNALVPRLAALNPWIDFHVFIPGSTAKNFCESIENVHTHVESDRNLLNPVRRLILEHVTIPLRIRGLRARACLVSGEAFGPLISLLSIPVVNIYHAAIQFYPGTSSQGSRLRGIYTRAMRDLCMRLVTQTIAVSHFERGELGGRYPQRMMSRIAVIYHAVDLDQFHPGPTGAPPFAFKYLLSVGDRHPHKAYVEMIGIFARLVKQHALQEDLVLVGRPKDPRVEAAIRDVIRDKGLTARVHLVDGVDQDEIAEMYRHARAYWTHSIHESFGLTPLEAMACGCPVVAAWRGAMPEVCGDAARFYDPQFLDEDGIARVIAKLVEDEQEMTAVSARGLQHVSAFSWDACAEHYSKILLDLIGRHL